MKCSNDDESYVEQICSPKPMKCSNDEDTYVEQICSLKVWNKLRSLAGLTNANPSMDSIIQLILPFAGRKSSRSVISKLVLAAAAYFLWQERNNRLFRKEKRSIDQVVDCIINSVRLKLVSCRWKSSRAALDIIKVWKLDSIFLHG
ncbi:hypothetical protein Tco_1570035 [Tanacetum coccineum]